MLIRINSENPQPRLIRQVVEHLRNGGLIAYPTDTFYGFGCDIKNKKAIEAVYRLKQRDQKQPFSFICSDLTHISEYAKVSNYAYRTMKRLLPGPYTFVLEGSKAVPKLMLTKRKTAGIRVPDNNICIELTKELGNPILSTSATSSDGTVFEDPSFIVDEFASQIGIVIDGGPVPGEPSSVISLIGDEPEILRTGRGDTSIFE